LNTKTSISTEGQSEGNSEEESLYRDRREGAGEAMVEILREERQIAWFFLCHLFAGDVSPWVVLEKLFVEYGIRGWLSEKIKKPQKRPH